jgi:hypothetical protein
MRFGRFCCNIHAELFFEAYVNTCDMSLVQHGVQHLGSDGLLRALIRGIIGVLLFSWKHIAGWKYCVAMLNPRGGNGREDQHWFFGDGGQIVI